MRDGTLLLVGSDGRCDVLCGGQVYVMQSVGPHSAWLCEGVGVEVRFRSGVPVGLRSLLSSQKPDVKITVIEAKARPAATAPSRSVEPSAPTSQSRELARPSSVRACSRPPRTAPTTPAPQSASRREEHAPVATPERQALEPYEQAGAERVARPLTKEEEQRVRDYVLASGGVLHSLAIFQKEFDAALLAASVSGVIPCLPQNKPACAPVPKKELQPKLPFGSCLRTHCDGWVTGDD